MNTKNISPVVVSKLRTHQILTEERITEKWPSKWGWLLEEQALLQAELKEISERSTILPPVKPEDPRSLKPYPNSTNHEYGWLATKPDMDLRTFGDDVTKIKPILDIHKLIHD